MRNRRVCNEQSNKHLLQIIFICVDPNFVFDSVRNSKTVNNVVIWLSKKGENYFYLIRTPVDSLPASSTVFRVNFFTTFTPFSFALSFVADTDLIIFVPS